MERIGFCPACKKTYAYDDANAKLPTCCGAQLKTTVYTLAQWSELTAQQKSDERLRFAEMYPAEAHAVPTAARSVTPLESIQADIHTIKNIMVFFTVLWGIGVFIGIIVALNSL